MDEQRPVEHTLLATTDAMIWAEEFCRIFKGWTITEEESMTDRQEDDRNVFGPFIGPGTMVGWFANAIEVGRNAGRASVDEDFARVWANPDWHPDGRR